MDFIQIIIGQYIFNIIGGTIRFVFGFLINFILKKPNYTYFEYLYGPKKTNFYDRFGHEFVNKIIGFCFIIFLILIIFLLTD